MRIELSDPGLAGDLIAYLRRRMVSVRRLSERQRASIRRGDFSDYAVETRDGPIGRLSAASSDALAEETLVVERAASTG